MIDIFAIFGLIMIFVVLLVIKQQRRRQQRLRAEKIADAKRRVDFYTKKLKRIQEAKRRQAELVNKEYRRVEQDLPFDEQKFNERVQYWKDFVSGKVK